MNEVQGRLLALQEKGWTLAAIADELGLTVNAIVKWKAGDRIPNNMKSILEHLDRVLQKRRVPKQRRYQKGSRVRSNGQQAVFSVVRPYGTPSTGRRTVIVSTVENRCPTIGTRTT